MAEGQEWAGRKGEDKKRTDRLGSGGRRLRRSKQGNETNEHEVDDSLVIDVRSKVLVVTACQDDTRTTSLIRPVLRRGD
jgi:hypothetical protein